MSVIRTFKEFRIENTNACGYRCTMCPREKQTRKLGFMSLEDFKLVISKLPKYPAILHLHGYGEPLLDKSLADKIRYAKQNTPYKTQIITTLGVDIGEQAMTDLVKSGLDTVLISFYGHTSEDYKRVHNVNKFELALKNLELFARICHEHNPKLSRFVKTLKPQPIDNLLQIGSKKPSNDSYDDLIQKLLQMGYKVGVVPAWHNYSNGRSYNPASEAICPVVLGQRNKILQVTWDLNVIPCCYDFDASMKFGNLRESTLDEIFNSNAYKHFVLSHIRKDLSQFPACVGCEKYDVS